jgi:hypothetical protein
MRVLPVGRGVAGKEVGGWIWCEYCVYRYVNAKMTPVETIPGMGIKEIEVGKNSI